MALESLPVPSVTAGISSRPSSLVDPAKVRDAENFLPRPEVGLTKRSGFDHKNQISASVYSPDRTLWGFDYGDRDKYVAVVAHDSIRVFNQSGREMLVRAVTKDADGVPIGGSSPDFSYLDLRARNQLSAPESLDSGSGPWSIIGDATNTQIAVGPQTPYGWPDNTGNPSQDAYSFLELTSGAGNDGEWVQGINGNLPDGLRFVAIHINKTDRVGKQRPGSISIRLEDPVVGGKNVLVTWNVIDDETSVPTVQANTEGFVTFEEDLGNNDFRLGFIYDPDRTSSPASTGASLQVSVRLHDSVAGDPNGLYAWGFQFEGNPTSKTEAVPYSVLPHTLRRAAAQGTTYVANPQVDPLMTAGTSDPGTFGTITFAGVGAGSPEAGVDIADIGLMFVKDHAPQAATLLYDYELRVRDTTGSGGTVDINGSVSASAGFAAVSAIAADINGHVNNTDGGTGGNEAQIVNATDKGTVVIIRTKEKDGETWIIDNVTIAQENSAASTVGINDVVDDISDLPQIAVHSMRVRIRPKSDPQEEVSPRDLIVRFEADFGGAAVPSAHTDLIKRGVWVEGTDYSVRDEIDETTAPHQLLLRQDDSTGVVTGRPFEFYFEWGPVEWAKRVVGDNLSNPFPSWINPPDFAPFETTQITGIGFFQNRLVIASGSNVAMSEVGEPGNFWRTTQQAVPDSDRIDVSSSSPTASPITDIVQNSGQIYLRTKRGVQAVVPSQQAVTPRTVGIEDVFLGGSGGLAEAPPVGNGIVIPEERTDSDALTLLVPDEGLVLRSVDLTEDIPKLPGRRTSTLVYSPENQLLFSHSLDDTPNQILVGRLSGSGPASPAAWARVTSEGAKFWSVAPVGDLLFVLTERDNTFVRSVSIEAARLDPSPEDPGQEWAVLLDRRITEEELTTAMSYAAGPDETTITMPFSIESDKTWVVSSRSGSDFGVTRTVNSQTTAAIKVSGDVTGEQLYIGMVFPASVRFHAPVPKRRFADGSHSPLVSSRQVVKEARLQFTRSAWAEALVTNPFSGSSTPSAAGVAPLYNGEGASSVILVDRRFAVGVLQETDTMNVQVVNETHLPTILAGVEWLTEIVDLGARVR